MSAVVDEARAKELFLDALEVPEPGRAAFVARGAAGDRELQARVDELFAAHGRAVERWTQRLGPEPRAGDEVGPYRLIALLGEGGFGAVWRARQETPVRRDVALKVLRSAVARGDGLARFEVERQILASLDHRGVARVFDAGASHGRPWFAMELVEGAALTDYVRAKRIGLRARLELFVDVCRAVQHAHQRGVIHRDLKPSNVLVRELDGRAEIKVIDFGIALVTSDVDVQRRTLAGQLLGTPSYMSPEQVRDTRDVDTRSDVYSLGALLCELLAGEPPFARGARGVSEMLARIERDEPEAPSTIAGRAGLAEARELRAELDWIVLRCLEKDRERRYASVAELAADVERHLRGEIVLASKPGTLHRARKFARRHAVGLSAAAVVVVALVGGLVASYTALVEARRARRAEQIAVENAMHQLERSRTTAEFLEHVLLSADPAVARGRDTTLLTEVLARAASGIADRGDHPPEVEADLRRIIGGAYSKLAEFGPALEQLERAWQLRRDELGPDAPETIESLAELGGVLLQSGFPARAEEPLREALERARRVFGAEDPRTLAVLSNFASAASALGRRDQSAELFAEIVSLRERTLGAEHADTLLARNNLAGAWMALGRVAEAAELRRAVLAGELRVHGERHPRTAAAMGNLSAALAELGREDEAIELAARALELKRELLGAQHPSVLVALNNLATLHSEAGRVDDALALLDEALASAAQGTEQHATLLVNRGNALRRLGRRDEALATLERALVVARETGGEDSRVAIGCAGALAAALLDAGRASEAEPLARKAVERLEATLPQQDPSYATARARLALVLAALGRTDEALALYTAAEPHLPPDSEWRARAAAAFSH